LRGGAVFKLLIFLAVVFCAAALAWMLLLPTLLITQLRQRTGFEASVQSLAANPFTGTIEIRGLIVTNPPTFPVTDFLELRSFSANARIFSLFSDRPVFTSVVVDAARVTIVKREGAVTNVSALSGNFSNPEQPPLPPNRARKEFLIERLIVRIEEVVIADHSGRVPDVQTYRLSLNQSYANVTGVKQLFTPSTLQGLLPFGSALNGFLPGAVGQALGEVVHDAARTGGKMLKRAGQTTGEKINGYFDALEESKKP
jgi:hypothetical protein